MDNIIKFIDEIKSSVFQKKFFHKDTSFLIIKNHYIGQCYINFEINSSLNTIAFYYIFIEIT